MQGVSFRKSSISASLTHRREVEKDEDEDWGEEEEELEEGVSLDLTFVEPSVIS